MVDTIVAAASKAAAIEALRGYHVQLCAQNERDYLGGNMPVLKLPDEAVYEYEGEDMTSRNSVYRANRTAVNPEVAKEVAAISDQVTANVRRRMNVAKNADRIGALRKAAADWRQRALDGRVNGLDSEVRELLIRKAEAAEAEADRLESGDPTSPVDEERARAFELEAIRLEARAIDPSLNESLRAYYRDRAREHRNSAAVLRGEKIQGEADQPRNREMSFTLPR